MTAVEYREYGLLCNGPQCKARFRGKPGEQRASVRRRAEREGWGRREHPAGRRLDDDFCPDHVDASSLPARVAHVTYALLDATAEEATRREDAESFAIPLAAVFAKDTQAGDERVTLRALKQAIVYGVAWNIYASRMTWADVKWAPTTRAWNMHAALEGRFLEEVGRPGHWCQRCQPGHADLASKRVIIRSSTGRVLIDQELCERHIAMEQRTAAIGMAEVELHPLPWQKAPS